LLGEQLSCEHLLGYRLSSEHNYATAEAEVEPDIARSTTDSSHCAYEHLAVIMLIETSGSSVVRHGDSFCPFLLIDINLSYKPAIYTCMFIPFRVRRVEKTKGQLYLSYFW